jgi:hypothetical protein
LFFFLFFFFFFIGGDFRFSRKGNERAAGNMGKTKTKTKNKITRVINVYSVYESMLRREPKRRTTAPTTATTSTAQKVFSAL